MMLMMGVEDAMTSVIFFRIISLMPITDGNGVYNYYHGNIESSDEFLEIYCTSKFFSTHF